MVNREEFARWWRQALHTLESAKRDRAAGDHAWACFKAEQAGQFALKALLRGLGRAAFGHSVSSLLREIGHLGVTLPEAVVEAARELERHYIPARYPDSYPSGIPSEYYTQRDADWAIASAEKILEFVRKGWEDAQGA